MAIHVVITDGETREIRKDREFGKPAESLYIKTDGTYIHVKTSTDGEVATKKRIDALGAGLTRDLIMGGSPEHVRKVYGHRDSITFEIWDIIGSHFPSGAPIYQDRITGVIKYTESDKAEQLKARTVREKLRVSEELAEAVA